MAIDITLRSALTTHGTASRSAARVDGAGFPQARRDKEAKYHELVEGTGCLLVVVAIPGGSEFRGVFGSSTFSRFPPGDAAFIVPLVETSMDTHVGCLVLPCARKFSLDGVDGPTPDLADLFRWRD